MNKYKKIRNILIWICIFMIIVLISVAVLVLFFDFPRGILKTFNTLASAISLGVVFFAIWYNRKKKVDAPDQVVRGKIISKHKEFDYHKNPLGLPEDWKCYLEVQMDDGTIQEFCTNVDFYLHLKPNQYGVLTYKIIDNQLRLMKFQSEK